MRDRPWTVLFVHQHPDNVAGQELSLCDRIVGLRAAGIESRVLLPGEGRFADLLRRLSVPVRTMPLGSWSRREPLPYLRAVQCVRAAIRTEEARVVHCSGAFPCQYSLPAARLARVPCVVHINTTVYAPSSYCRNLVPHADLIIAISRAVEGQIRSSIPVPAGRLRVIYNGIAVPGGRGSCDGAGTGSSAAGSGGEWRHVGQFGAVIPRKGCEHMIAAAARVIARHPRVRFYFVGAAGPPEYTRKLDDLVRELGLADRLVFTGFQEDVGGWLRKMDVTVLCSHQEGLGRSLVESQLVGRPVIGTDVEGIAESIEHGVTGLLVRPGDADALAEAILTLLGQPALGARLAEAAEPQARARHDLFRQGAELADCYHSLFRRRGAAAG